MPRFCFAIFSKGSERIDSNTTIKFRLLKPYDAECFKSINTETQGTFIQRLLVYFGNSSSLLYRWNLNFLHRYASCVIPQNLHKFVWHYERLSLMVQTCCMVSLQSTDSDSGSWFMNLEQMGVSELLSIWVCQRRKTNQQLKQNKKTMILPPPKLQKHCRKTW